MRGRLVASLVSAVVVAMAGVGVSSAVPAAAGFHSPVSAKANIAAEPLSPKLRAAARLGTSRTRNSAIPQLAASVPCNSSWNAIASPNASTNRNEISGVAAVAPNDVWAVGDYVNGSGVFQTLAEHWDGHAWTIVPTPNAGPGNNLLAAVAAIASNDVWAVGYWRTDGSSSPGQPLTQHWNGNNWTIVGAPIVANTSTLLFGVSADASNDVWAVGISVVAPQPSVGPRGQPYAMHWTGSSWAEVIPPVPMINAGPADVSSLNGVKALSPMDVWAVGDGQQFIGNTPSSPDNSFMEHSNGTSWSEPPSPSHPNGDFLADVQGRASDLWAVGGQVTSSTTDTVVIEHWNGIGPNWTDVGSSLPPAAQGQTADLFALGYVSGNNAWAVGARSYQNPGTNLELDDTLVEHWDGTSWYPVISDNPSSSQALLTMTAISANDAWAAGWMLVNGYAQTLIQNFCAPPAVASIAPSSGNAGDTVVITGNGFSRAIDVEFGATPAFSFHVDSDMQITAVSPGHKAGTVDVTVTVQGTSATSSADQFTYVFARDSGAQQPIAVPFRSRSTPPVSKLAAAISAIIRALAQFIAG